MERIGRVPLPPYIRGGNMVDGDVERYQTVFARRPGAVAAPTAGLHFTPELLAHDRPRAASSFSAVTLHVGMGTFRPIAVDDPAEHPMHAEWAELSDAAAREITPTRGRGRPHRRRGHDGRADARNRRRSAAAAGRRGRSSRPGRARRGCSSARRTSSCAVDALLTNFHFPRTTLLLLVQAFGGSALIRQAYETAVAEQYRFYSYGDAMLIQ